LSCLVRAETAGAGTAERHSFAVLVAGAPLRHNAAVQARGGRAESDARNWLEGGNAELRLLNPNPAAPECSANATEPSRPVGGETLRVSIARTPGRNDVVVLGRTEGAP
jgi:hypothetical protein